MTESITDQFVRLLAGIEEPAKREALLRRVKLQAMNEVVPEAFEPPVKTLGEYLETPIEVPPSLVWPTIVVRGELTATLGRAGYGKTTMNLNRILKWGAGLPFFDTFRDEFGKPYLMPEKPLRILIIENEGSAGMFHHKMGVMLHNCGGILTDENRQAIRENVLVWGDGGYSGLKIDDPAMLNQVRAGVEQHEPDILFIEPFRSLWKGEENSSTEMAVVTDNLVALATDYGCGVIISHHERKGGAGDDGELMSAGRGSTVLEGVVAVMENFKKARGDELRELSWSKSRYLAEPPNTNLEYDKDTLWYRHISVDELDDQIMRVLQENGEQYLSTKQINEELGEQTTEYACRKTSAILKRLVKANRLKMTKNMNDPGQGNVPGYRIPSNKVHSHGGISI